MTGSASWNRTSLVVVLYESSCTRNPTLSFIATPILPDSSSHDSSTRARICKLLRSPGINSASLCSMVDWCDNPIPTRFLAPLECLKIPAQTQTIQETVSKMQSPSINHVAAENFLRECPFIHLHPKWHAPRLAWEKMGENWETVGGKREIYCLFDMRWEG